MCVARLGLLWCLCSFCVLLYERKQTACAHEVTRKFARLACLCSICTYWHIAIKFCHVLNYPPLFFAAQVYNNSVVFCVLSVS
nr:MAG TPA: hypothetical protein [Caudoviricetes sp.]